MKLIVVVVIIVVFYAKLQDVSVTMYTSIYWYRDDIGLCLCDDDVVCCVCLLHSYTYAFLVTTWIGKLVTRAYALMPLLTGNWRWGLKLWVPHACATVESHYMWHECDLIVT